jgi:ABC-type glycerol-3-phosphate transport system substrate-binding protein
MDGFAIYSKSKDLDAAWTVVQELVSPEAMLTRQQQAGLIASRRSVAAEWPKLYPDKGLQAVFDTMNDAQPDPLSIWDRSAEVWNAIQGTIEQMMLQNTMSVPDGMAKMQETVEKIYAS